MEWEIENYRYLVIALNSRFESNDTEMHIEILDRKPVPSDDL